MHAGGREHQASNSDNQALQPCKRIRPARGKISHAISIGTLVPQPWTHAAANNTVTLYLDHYWTAARNIGTQAQHHLSHNSAGTRARWLRACQRVAGGVRK